MTHFLISQVRKWAFSKRVFCCSERRSFPKPSWSWKTSHCGSNWPCSDAPVHPAERRHRLNSAWPCKFCRGHPRGLRTRPVSIGVANPDRRESGPACYRISEIGSRSLRDASKGARWCWRAVQWLLALERPGGIHRRCRPISAETAPPRPSQAVRHDARG